MNKQCFKTVFSKRLGCLVAVGEHASSQGKANGASGAPGVAGASLGTWSQFVGVLVAGSAAVGLAWAAPANNALPTGGQVAQGGASISTNGANMNIQQTTAKAVVNWQSFDIGKDAKVNIQQPGADSVMLNRVTGANPSQIFGQLNANGQVVLVNPNGVLFGKDGSVSATSFTASTLGISDANFMAGNMQYERNGSTASVVNQGSIKTSGGYVALLGASVSNEGKIETNGGTAYLAAAETVKVPLSGSGRIKLELSPSAINAAVSNSKEGTIVTQGGQVYMQAAALNTAVASIIQSGAVDTTGNQGGAVHLLADGGTIKVDGSITANSTGQDDKGQQRKGGDIVIGRDEETGTLAASTDVSGAVLESKGGFVDTSGHHLTADGVQVIAKDWLLDPDDIEINNNGTATNTNYSQISNATIKTALNKGTAVTIATTTPTYTGITPPASSTTHEGNVLVSGAITKDANTSLNGANPDASLTLIADNGLTVNAAITSTSGKLDINLTAKGMTNGKPVSGVGAMSDTERALSRGLFINGVSLDAKGGDITLSGTSYANASATRVNGVCTAGNCNAMATNAIGKGVQIHNGANLSGHNITVTGTADNQSGQTSYGVVFQRYPTQATVTATGNISITGTLNGGGRGSGVFFSQSGWGAQAPMIHADGDFTLRGNNRGDSANANPAVYILSGMQVTARGNIAVLAETNNATAAAIEAYSQAYSGTNFYGVNPGPLHGNTSLRSVDVNGNASGNVLIQANQGRIAFNNLLNPSLSSGTLTALTEIKGKNISIDNTGAGMVTGVGNTAVTGGIDAATGVITAGGGSAASGNGVHIADGRAINADGNINILGRSSQATGGAGAVLAATIKASKDISLEGYSANTSTNQGLVIQNAVTSETGDITVKGETRASGQRAVAITSNGTLSHGRLTVADGKKIEIQANTLLVNANTAINAGATGTVSIKTLTQGNEILVGGEDALATALSDQKLGIGNAELNGISAGQLIIGDAQSSGRIVVAAATDTASTTGHLTLRTGGDIAINNGLKVGANGEKNLTLESGGTSVGGAGKITANQLRITAANAAVAMASVDNAVKELAASVKSIDFKNGQNLVIGTIDGVSGINAKQGVKVVTSTGNLNISQKVTNTDGGEVVLGAGVGNSGAELTEVGDVVVVDTVTGPAVSNGNRNVFVYTGTLASADQLAKNSKLSANFTELLLDDNLAVNTAHKDSSDNLNKIVNGLSTQVLVREQKTFDFTQSDNQLKGALLPFEYGSDKTKREVNTDALWADMKSALKDANSANGQTKKLSLTHGTVTVSVRADKVIDTLTRSVLSNVGYSSAYFLNAGTYDYSGVNTTAYKVAFIPGSKVQVQVTPKELALTIDGVQTTYGTAAATGAAQISGGNVGTDVVKLSGTVDLRDATFSGSGKLRAGTYTQQFVAAVGSTGLTGKDAGNYKLPDSTSAANYVVTPKAISATVTAVDKVYDGNAVAALQATSADVLTGDQVSVGGLTGTFASKNVARDASGNVVAQAVTVSGSGANLGGNDGANYVLSNAASIAPTSARITPKDLTVTGITASDKVYDGTTAAAISVGNAALAGVVSGDAVSLAGQAASGNFASKNVAFDGSGAVASQSVQVAGLSLGGSDARNYTLTGQTSAQAKILQRAVTIAGSVAQDKSYDGNTTATVVPGQLSNMVAGESLAVNASGTFEDAEIGSGKAVAATYRLANGANGLASNYTLINATEVLRAAILSANRNPLSPIITPGGGGSGSRVVISGSGSSGAAVGVADDDISNRQECSVLHPEKCECEESTIPGIEMCFAPNVALNNKD